MNDITPPEVRSGARVSLRRGSSRLLACVGFFAAGVACTTLWSLVVTRPVDLEAPVSREGASTPEGISAPIAKPHRAEPGSAEAVREQVAREEPDERVERAERAVALARRPVSGPSFRSLPPFPRERDFPQSSSTDRETSVTSRADAHVASQISVPRPASLRPFTDLQARMQKTAPAKHPSEPVQGPTRHMALPPLAEMEAQCRGVTLLESMPPSFCSCDAGEFEQVECHVSASLSRSAMR